MWNEMDGCEMGGKARWGTKKSLIDVCNRVSLNTEK